MESKLLTQGFFKQFKEFLGIVGIIVFVLLVNYPIISTDLMYPEQPPIYTANQLIVNFSDLWQVYLHPKLFHVFSTPFFRPSGHFLIYQLITPLLGWHNTRAFIIINLIFLALSGYVMIKLYQLLFPQFRVGGYIAFSFYLMHPALTLSRVIIQHFEFAYVFFLLLSLYCFAVFCRNNQLQIVSIPRRFHSYYLVMLTLLFYFIAITFKESALMLGPVLACYFILSLYDGQSIGVFARQVLRDKQTRQMIILLVLVSMTFVLYLTSAWPSLANPVREITPFRILVAINIFLKMLLDVNFNFIPDAWVGVPIRLWHVSTVATHVIVWILTAMTVLNFFFLKSMNSASKKSLLFLFCAAVLFIILPIGWSMGLPWHLSLTILSLSMIMGFGFENVCCHLLGNKKTVFVFGMCVALFIGITTIFVDRNNFAYLATSEYYFATVVDRNAITNPPPIQKQLNRDSIIVVEDNLLHSDYFLGDGGYPLYALNLSKDGFDHFANQSRLSFIKYQTYYNGTLFRWAYLIPTLREEVYPFDIQHMSDVPNEIVYNWLQHYNNIFCLGYDKTGQWHDHTVQFKQQLLIEKTRRALRLNDYHMLSHASLGAKPNFVLTLPLADDQLCRYKCDQDSACHGFTFVANQIKSELISQCGFYNDISQNPLKNCLNCVSFIRG